jgi:hypothetical protein
MGEWVKTSVREGLVVLLADCPVTQREYHLHLSLFWHVRYIPPTKKVTIILTICIMSVTLPHVLWVGCSHWNPQETYSFVPAALVFSNMCSSTCLNLDLARTPDIGTLLQVRHWERIGHGFCCSGCRETRLKNEGWHRLRMCLSGTLFCEGYGM